MEKGFDNNDDDKEKRSSDAFDYIFWTNKIEDWTNISSMHSDLETIQPYAATHQGRCSLVEVFNYKVMQPSKRLTLV